ncbi:MAG: phage tail protein [Peptostreptococcaceae bacterium]|nr:phage tail protein [Peptostreptococcaceae bacterium]
MNNIIDAKIKKVYNDAYTLNLQLVGEQAQRGDVLTVDNQSFKVHTAELEGVNKNIQSIYAEHISYELNESNLKVQKDESGKYTLKGVYLLSEAIYKCLEGTSFNPVIQVTNNKQKSLNYGEMTRREALIKLANDYDVWIDFDNFNVIVKDSFEDKGAVFKYALNLKNITKITNDDGVGYKIEIVEEPQINLGDIITVVDKTINVDVKLKVLSIEYNPFNRFESVIEVGTLEKSFSEDIVNMYVDAKNVVIPPPEKVVYQQITQVFKKEVIKAEVIHAVNSWIEELEVNYLRTNFDGRQGKLGKYWNFIYIHDMKQEFITAELSDVEKVNLTTVSGKTIYWTAIGSNEDAYKYFTLQAPNIPDGAVAIFNGVERPVYVADFYVTVPKIVNQYTKMIIDFEDLEGDLQGVPVITLGTGTGEGDGGKAKIYKGKTGLVFEYTTSDGKLKKVVKLDDTANNLRNVGVYDSLPDAGAVGEGDVVFVRGA